MKKINLITFTCILSFALFSSRLSSQCITCNGNNSGYIGTSNTLGSTTNTFITGTNSLISANSSAIIGSYSTIRGSYSYIMGYNSTISSGCISSYIFGEKCTVGNTSSMLIGYNLKTTTGNSFAIGYGKLGAGNELSTTVPYSLIVGFNSKYPTLFVGETPANMNSGRIGIGNITNPSAKLHIKADDVEDASLLLESSTDKVSTLGFIGSKAIISSISSKVPLIFSTNGLNNTRMIISGENGWVGIGNMTAPEGKLHIKANEGEDATVIIEPSATSKLSGLIFKNSKGIIATTDANQSINFYTGSTMLRMKIDGNGNVGIGVETPGYKLHVAGNAKFDNNVIVENGGLYVNGEIKAKQYLATISPFPDFVFQPDYSLMSLNELEKYIKKYNHLPNVPSSLEAENEGVELGKMNAILLQKIEELTLYIIAQQKEIDLLNESLNNK